MTKKHQEATAAIASTGQGSHQGAMVDKNDHDKDYATDSRSSSAEPHPAMYHFGQAGEGERSIAMYYTLPPPLNPTLQFTAMPQFPEDERDQPDLFSTYITSELHESGVNLDEFLHPYFPPDVPEQYEQHDGDDGVPDTINIPVYPRHHVAQLYRTTYQSGAPNAHYHFPVNANNVSSTPANGGRLPLRSKGSTDIKTNRPIFPKGGVENRHAPPNTFDANEPHPGQKRRRALSPESRENAHQVRIRGACARCSSLRTKCDTNRPCRTCLGEGRRKLDIPCVDEFPMDRWGHLFTDVMYGHLDHAEKFRSMPKPTVKREFTLRLQQYFDDPELTIPVREFVPRAEQDINQSIFPITQNGDNFEVQEAQILSPPLVPAITQDTSLAYSKYFYRCVHRWLECAQIYEDLEWHKTFFREEYGKPWPRMVFGQVCSFYHVVTRGGCPVLKSCLATTILVYMLGHSFYVPPEDVPDLLAKTEFGAKYGKEPTFYVSPVYVDRFVKILLFPIYKGAVKASLRGFQNLYSPAKPTKFKRDRLLASSIVLLIVAASQQGKAIEKALAQHRKGNFIDTDLVYEQIYKIEKHIIDMVLDLWRYKFASTAKLPDEDREYPIRAIAAKNFNLMEKFKESYDGYSERLKDLPLELPTNLDPKTFGADNVERVLKRFYLCVFPIS